MSVLPRRQSLPVLVLALALVAAAWLVSRPASEAAAPTPTKAANAAPLTGAGTITFAQPALTLPITSFQVGGSTNVTSGSGDPQAGPVVMSEATVTLDSSVDDPAFYRLLAEGRENTKVTVAQPDKKGRREWVFNEVIVSSTSWSQAKNGTVSLSLWFSKATLTSYGWNNQVVSSYCYDTKARRAC